MAIEQTYKQSEIEKRLKLLRTQVYGKKQYQISESKQSGGSSPKTSALSLADTSYVYKDLLKVAIYSSIAIGIQLVFYIALRNNLVKLPFS